MEPKCGIVRAVCISRKKGEQKTPVEEVRLLPHHGIVGDAHAGDWHRQVSLLGTESVARLQERLPILCEGLRLYELPGGTTLRVGSALCQITQIGK